MSKKFNSEHDKAKQLIAERDAIISKYDKAIEDIDNKITKFNELIGKAIESFDTTSAGKMKIEIDTLKDTKSIYLANKEKIESTPIMAAEEVTKSINAIRSEALEEVQAIKDKIWELIEQADQLVTEASQLAEERNAVIKAIHSCNTETPCSTVRDLPVTVMEVVTEYYTKKDAERYAQKVWGKR